MIAHLRLLSPIPEEERSQSIRDVFSVPFADGVRHYWRDVPPSSTPEGYAQWKKDCADKPSERHPDWPLTCKCGAKRCYASWYCENPRCATGASVEGHDLVLAIKNNDLVEAVRLFSIVFPYKSVDDLAEFIHGIVYIKDGEPAGSRRSE